LSSRGAWARAVALAGAAGVALACASGAPGRAIAPPAAAPPCSADYSRGTLKPTRTLRFGIDPELAGSAGSVQNKVKPINESKSIASLRALRPHGKELVLRINRMFEADGEAGIRRFKRTIDAYTHAGFDTELQVRYHPAASQVGDIPAWLRYVRRVVDVFGPNRHLLAMTITNEINLAFSPNTSDGAYPGAEQALVQGIVAAHREAQRRGFRQLRFGFTFAYRFNPVTDAALFTGLRSGGAVFRSALGFVGVDYYPELYPGRSTPIPSATRQMMGTMRRCFMRLGGLGPRVPIWITESGVDTPPGRISQRQQRSDLVQIIDTIKRAANTFGVTDYRWFNLRDNLSTAQAFGETTGLLTDDYGRKLAFAAYRHLIEQFGALAPG
jgi:hypothetical protein